MKVGMVYQDGHPLFCEMWKERGLNRFNVLNGFWEFYIDANGLAKFKGGRRMPDTPVIIIEDMNEFHWEDYNNACNAIIEKWNQLQNEKNK